MQNQSSLSDHFAITPGATNDDNDEWIEPLQIFSSHHS